MTGSNPFLSAAMLAVVLALISSSLLLVSAHVDVHPLSKVMVQNIQYRKVDGAVIRIEAPMLLGMGEFVNVSFSGMSSTNQGSAGRDWIGVWSPAPANGNYSSRTPSKYLYVTPGTSGSGEVRMWLVNMRESVTVAYFTGGLTTPVLLAESQAVEFENVHLPMHFHLALTGDPTQMRVDWTSAQDATNGPWLHWGEQRTNLSHSVKQVLTSTYTAADMCGAPATTVGFHTPGFLHTALIEGLRPNVEYFYQVGDSTPRSEGPTLNFWAAPAPDALNVEFFIFGDLGQAETDGSNEESEMAGSLLTTRGLIRDVEQGVVKLNASAAVFHIGDISYAFGYATVWEQFFSQISPLSPHLPWMVVDGNHERDFPNSGSVWTGTDSGGECGVALAQRFHMPNPTSPAPRGLDQTWWSLDFGPVHFTVISTEHQFNVSSPQYEWIQQDLAKVDRTRTPFLLLAGHRPMYIDSTNDAPMGGDTTVGDQLAAALEPLMQKYQVDAAFWGHHHSYQRTCPAHNFTCVDETKGTIHIVTGAAGAGFSQNIQPIQPKWIEVVNDYTHGYVIARVKEGKTLTLDFINATSRAIIDSVTINSKFRAQREAQVEGKRDVAMA